MAGSSTKVVVIAFVMNLGIAIAKFIGYFLSGSAAMLAEGVHSLADTTNQVFLYLGIRKSKQSPTRRHPFGYGMEQYIFSFLVAMLIFSLGGIYSLYEGIHKIIHPSESIENGEINLIILGIGILLDGYSALAATKEVNKIRGKLSIAKFIRKSKDQILVTVLFEDYAALFGLTIAAGGTILYMVTGNVLYDAIATLLIGALLMVIAGFLYFEAKSLLVGEAADPEDLEKIENAFMDHPKVDALRELLTMHLSATQILVNAHVKFKSGLTLEEVEDIIDEIEVQIIKDVPLVYKIFIETHQNSQVVPLQTDPQPGESYDDQLKKGKSGGESRKISSISSPKKSHGKKEE